MISNSAVTANHLHVSWIIGSKQQIIVAGLSYMGINYHCNDSSVLFINLSKQAVTGQGVNQYQTTIVLMRASGQFKQLLPALIRFDLEKAKAFAEQLLGKLAID